MPRIFDNIEQHLLPALRETIRLANRADFSVGYLNLRGWKQIAPFFDEWAGGDGRCCRLLIGMQRAPQDELREAFAVTGEGGIDNQTALRLRQKLAQEFRDQLTVGIPNNQDEAALRKLANQIRAKQVVVRLFLRHALHAKLYLLFREDPINPIIGYVGSSNLTMAGLSKQGELNVDVVELDAAKKLSKWFEDRWDDHWCVDISDELAEIIEQSWAGEDIIPPYHIYIKIAYHLSQEAIAGLSEFSIPREFGKRLFKFQSAAVKIAAHHIHKRNGVLIGDVVGLGKTLMASAVAKIFEEDFGLETLIICPKNLVKMWEDYRDQYRLYARVLSISKACKELPNLRRYRVVLIDESHNLRNREGKTYRSIQEYITKNESRCILLTATPYNKTYLDLSNQLRLFVPEDKDLGIRPEELLREIGEIEFNQRYQASPRSLAAFEKSEFADDWRELMRLYLVRRTRSFIMANYAETDPENARKYLTMEDGTRSYFPTRVPRKVTFRINDDDPADQYARLYGTHVVDTINGLKLPRYGLGNYVNPPKGLRLTPAEISVIDDLSRAGKRLMGFTRTNLFKRLESGGEVFIQSIERHVLRNYVVLHALENDLPVPVGSQDAHVLDARVNDSDIENVVVSANLIQDEEEEIGAPDLAQTSLRTEQDFKRRAAEIYKLFSTLLEKRFKWMRPVLFQKSLAKDLLSDGQAFIAVLEKNGEWNPATDAKLNALYNLLTRKHPNEKVLVFTQFADTVHYLQERLQARGVARLAGVTGDSPDPTLMAWRFSPVSNNKRDQVKPEDELRVLIATDVLSEGQNLQDAYIVVNYDLPWAIIRLVQRAGRVDRIGQTHETILAYSFLPAAGVELIIHLRDRVRRRLQENAEVIGTDEMFFEDDRNDQVVRDLFTERAGILDDVQDGEVDLASYAYQIWKNATTADPNLQKTIPALPPVVYSARPFNPTPRQPEGVLVYLKTAEANDALAWVDNAGNSVTESQYAILRAAECEPTTPALVRAPNHHDLVSKGVELIAQEEGTVGGQLGRPSGARFKTYSRLKRYAESVKGTLFETQDLLRAIDDIYRYPLRPTAVDTLNRQLRGDIPDERLVDLVIALRNEDRLCIMDEEAEWVEPRIICSLGLRAVHEEAQ